jgi:uncharacterized membrane protein YccC
MLGSDVIGCTRERLERVWSSRLAMPLRPASSGPVRYWQDQIRLAVKAAIAAVGAWALAKYAVGQPDPYFAPLAALLGVYPTVARSLREGVQYVAGFLLGAALAVPVGILLGPGIAGIAVVVMAGVLVSGWHRLGNQSPQVTFTALFALLLGGHQPFTYITHRMIDVGIGVATGLAVNVLMFPPLQLRPAEHAIRQWGNDIARALEDLSAAVADPDSGMRAWPRHDRQLTVAAEQAPPGRPQRAGEPAVESAGQGRTSRTAARRRGAGFPRGPDRADPRGRPVPARNTDRDRDWPEPGVVRPGLRGDSPDARRSRPPARRPAIFPAPWRVDRRTRLPASPRAGNGAAARPQR